MSRLSSTAPRPPRVLFLVLAVGLIGLLGMIGTVVWIASSWDIDGMGGMMGSDHMSRMMGGGRDASGAPPGRHRNRDDRHQDFAYPRKPPGTGGRQGYLDQSGQRTALCYR
jgi:hypothetical protein